MDLKKMSMSQLIAHHNALAEAKGVATATEFKNLAAARAAINHLEGTSMTEETQVPADGEQVATPEGETSRYSTVGKRGPNQGVGEFAKQLLVTGMPTAEVLAKVKEQFPTAKTSASCIAYYKAALKNPNLGKRKSTIDPEALRAKAQALLDQAAAAEAAAQAAAEPAVEAAPVEQAAE